jgi:hypothetical protein
MVWRLLPNSSEVLAIHAALLRTGEILYFGGDEHDAGQNEAGRIDHTRLFDCATLVVTNLGSPTSDVFCSGHAFLADGRLLVAGGTQHFPSGVGGHAPHFPGLRDSWVFNPRFRQWVQVAAMNTEPGRPGGGGRWYPSLLTLASGAILAISGHPAEDDTRHSNDSPEIFSPSPSPAGTWRLLSGPDPAHDVAYYPRVHVLPDGEVFCATPIGGRNLRLRPEPYRWTDVAAGPVDPIYHGFDSTSVLLPLLPENGYQARVLICNGAQPMVIDLGADPPSWTPTGPRTLEGSPPRHHANAVLLPTGEVLVCGGVRTTGPGSDATAVLQTEVFDPQTNSWTTHPAASVVRNYHSVALLMPDGRVWTAGGNRDGQQSFPSPGVDNRELRIEIYEPPYVTASRPQILWAPAAVGWEQSFDVETTQVEDITRVAAVRAGSVTHSFDFDQRYVGLEFSRAAGNWLSVRAPLNPAIAPPGYYLLFTINRSGIPSAGRFMRVSSMPGQAAS